MKTNHVFSVMAGAALLGGMAFAEPERPEGEGPRGEGRGMRPERERMEMRERMMQQRDRMGRGGQGKEEGGCPGMCPGRGGPEGEGGPKMGPGGPMLGRGPQRIPGPERLKELGATDQQMEALKTLDQEQELKRVDLQAAVEKAELVMRQTMQNEKADEATALKAADELIKARGELMKQEIASKIKAKAILGDELVKKLREMGPPPGMTRQGRGPGAERGGGCGEGGCPKAGGKN